MGTGNLGCYGLSFVGSFIKNGLKKYLLEVADGYLMLSLGRRGIETDLTSPLFL